MDLWQQVRELWGVSKAAANRPAKVDYDGLLAELKNAINQNRHKIGELVFVPCDYLVQLSPQDTERFRSGGLSSPLQYTLQKAVQEHVKERGYHVQGPVSVRLGEDADLGEGFVKVSASHTASSPGAGMGASNDSDQTVLGTPPGMPQANFEVVKGDTAQQGKRLELQSFPAILGRVTRTQSPSVGVVDPSSNVGREHALIEYRNGGFSIRDTSQNGTWVNGVRLKRDEKTVLLDGAEVGLAGGIVVLRFHSGDQTVMQGRKGNWATS